MIEGKTVSKTKRSGRILDMGYCGLQVRVPEVLEAYAEIRIGFALSLMSEARSDVYARVLRAQEVDGQWECQLEFTFIEDEARKELKAYIDQIVETS